MVQLSPMDGLPAQIRVGPDNRILTNRNAWLDVSHSRIDDGHTCQHVQAVDAHPHDGFRFGQMDTGIYANDLGQISTHERLNRQPGIRRQPNGICQVIFTFFGKRDATQGVPEPVA